MKNIFLALMICFVCVKSFTLQAQTIASDEVNSHGIRTICGTLENVRDFKDRAVFNVGLWAITDSTTKVTKYSLAIKVLSMARYEVKKDMVFLIKTTNGDIITLKASYDSDANWGDVHNVNGFVYVDYSTLALYPITEEQILKIAQGVTKIRQEIVAGTFEKEFKRDKIGKIIVAEYEQIKVALETTKSITDGF